MPLKTFNPTTPSRRNMVSTSSEVTKPKPERRLVSSKKKSGGRNFRGVITSRHIGGGAKLKVRQIDFKRDKPGISGTNIGIEYDPGRSARLALIQYADGDKRSPLGRHGGTVFGPHPRSYEQALPKKMRRLAIRCMLSDKQRNGELVILRDAAFAEGKTKEVSEALTALGLTGTTLLVTAQADPKVVHAAHNLPGLYTLPASLLNVGDLLKYRNLVMTVDAVKVAEGLWAQDKKRRGQVTQVSGGQA